MSPIKLLYSHFSVAGLWLWNSLPAKMRQPDVEIRQFRRLLKTFLFARDCGAQRLFLVTL